MRGRTWASISMTRLGGRAPKTATTPRLTTQRLMETPVRHLILAAIAATALTLPLAGSASAQSHPAEHMSSCNQAVGQMKFEGWPADRMREMMMSSCLNNHGVIPGAQAQTEQKPVSLHHQNAQKTQRHR